MKITLQRTKEVGETTLGELSIDGKFFCYTLEDKIRTKKIKHQTCIPQGTYGVILSLSQRFKTVLPLLVNVPGFEGIRIHAGNTTEDTSGCILLGTAVNEDKLLHSKVALTTFLQKVTPVFKKGEQITIEVKNPIVEKKPKVEIPVETPIEKPTETPVAETPVEQPIEQQKDPVVTSQNKKFTLSNIIQWILTLILKKS